VVHVSSGCSALVFALVLGKRLGYPRERILPHNLTMVLLGAGLLWFGWFGFNGGSALAASGVAVLALVNSQLAAAMGGMVWLVVDIARYGKASALGFASGFIAGLATVTPASGYVGPMGALAIGAAAGLACYGAVMLKGKLGYDDTLDAFGVHGVGGAVGTILLGVFALRAWNPAGADGLLAGTQLSSASKHSPWVLASAMRWWGLWCCSSSSTRSWACVWAPSKNTRAWTSTCTAKRATTWAWACPREARLRSSPNRRLRRRRRSLSSLPPLA